MWVNLEVMAQNPSLTRTVSLIQGHKERKVLIACSLLQIQAIVSWKSIDGWSTLCVPLTRKTANMELDLIARTLATFAEYHRPFLSEPYRAKCPCLNLPSGELTESILGEQQQNRATSYWIIYWLYSTLWTTLIVQSMPNMYKEVLRTVMCI